ncbi:MAG TPA: hypothetical protein VGO34_09485 [Alphaproteobacteria bacterium]|jgi:hypothetical protein
MMPGEPTAKDAAAHERSAWIAAAAILGLAATLKGWRTPNLWAATQAQLDYGLGFVKRGLFGEVLSLLGLHIERYTDFGYLSWILLAATLGLLAQYVRTSGAFRAWDNGSLVALFASSFGLTYLAHLAGYLDIVLLCLALLALLVPHAGLARLAVLLAAVIGVCVHESYLFLFFPVTLLPALLPALDEERPSAALLMLGGLVLAVGLCVLFVAFDRSLSPAELALLQGEIAARTDFPLRADFFEVLGRSATDNLRIMAGIMREGHWWRDHLVAGVTMLPTCALFLWASLGALRRHYGGWRRRVATTAALAASLSPLLLQVFGWDIYRWYALTVVTSFLTMVAAGRHCLPQGEASMLGPRLRVLAIVLIGLNMASGEGLMDEQRVAAFPFKSLLSLVQDIRAHEGRLPIPQN